MALGWGITRPLTNHSILLSFPCILKYMERNAALNSIADDIEIITNYLKSIGCSEIYLFGSAAEDHASETSDLDFAVRGIPANKFFAIYGEVLNRSSRPVDLVDLDLQVNFGRQILSNPHVKRVA